MHSGHSGTARTRPNDYTRGPNDVDATSTSHEQHGWDIHAFSVGGGNVTRATAACQERRNTRGAEVHCPPGPVAAGDGPPGPVAAGDGPAGPVAAGLGAACEL